MDILCHNTTHPLVTIGVPTYNSEMYLKSALDSIAAQSYKNFEVIISDNGSTDNTYEIVKAYATKYGWTHSQNSGNIGAVKNFNRLIALSSGRYVAIYHADDIYDSCIIEECVKVLENDSEIALVGTLCRIIDKDNRITRHVTLPPTIADLRRVKYSFDESLLGVLHDRHIFFATPSIMVRKRAYSEVGTFSEDLQYRSAADYEMWLRIARHASVAVVPKPLLSYRVHEGQGSQTEIRNSLEIPDILLVLRVYLKWLSDKEVRDLAISYICRYTVITAIKQNMRGRFEDSNRTLKGLKGKWAASSTMISWLNDRGFRIRYAVGRTLYRVFVKMRHLFD